MFVVPRDSMRSVSEMEKRFVSMIIYWISKAAVDHLMKQGLSVNEFLMTLVVNPR